MGDLLKFVLSQEDRFRSPRLPSLFSDFTLQRQTNPSGYTANVETWEAVLCEAARARLVSRQDGSNPMFSLEIGPHLLQQLESKQWGRPLALDAVFNEAISQGRMIPYQVFVSSPNPIYSRRWTDLPWRLLSWSMEKIGLVPWHLCAEIRSPREFVLVPNIEESFGKLMVYIKRRSSQVDRILTIEMFRKDLAAALGFASELTDSDFKILLTYLARDKQVLAYDGNVIKLAAPHESPASVSKEDGEIASLKSLMSEISEQISLLEIRIVALRERTQKAVETKNRSSALAALRSKKVAEAVLARRADTLFQLEEIYQNIEQASDQLNMVHVMRGSFEVLRGLNAKVGSTHDVEDVLEGLKNEMGRVNDVGTLFSQPGQETNDVDKHALDEELDALMRRSRQAEEEETTEQTMQRLATIQLPSRSDDITANKPEDPQQSTNTEAQGSSLRYDIGALECMSLDSPSDGERDSQKRQRNETTTWERS